MGICWSYCEACCDGYTTRDETDSWRRDGVSRTTTWVNDGGDFTADGWLGRMRGDKYDFNNARPGRRSTSVGPSSASLRRREVPGDNSYEQPSRPRPTFRFFDRNAGDDEPAYMSGGRGDRVAPSERSSISNLFPSWLTGGDDSGDAYGNGGRTAAAPSRFRNDNSWMSNSGGGDGGFSSGSRVRPWERSSNVRSRINNVDAADSASPFRPSGLGNLTWSGIPFN